LTRSSPWRVSTHDEAELFRALETELDYTFGAARPAAHFRMEEKKSAKYLVGIGGITPERATGVLEAGADSAAVVTDIAWNADPA
jgi:thiamine-phosphate pyrophosphorylase